MLILHLSDLHFGTHSRFKGEDLAKLGKAFFKDLTAARGTFAKGSRIDLVAVTGDIAESGKPTEFKDGERFLAALAGELGLDRRRFVFVPGNHDVSWTACDCARHLPPSQSATVWALHRVFTVPDISTLCCQGDLIGEMSLTMLRAMAGM